MTTKGKIYYLLLFTEKWNKANKTLGSNNQSDIKDIKLTNNPQKSIYNTVYQTQNIFGKRQDKYNNEAKKKLVP